MGLYYYGARWYDPALGRFAQADTLVPGMANPQNLNRYSYVLNNPLRYTDPTGHCIPGVDCPGTTDETGGVAPPPPTADEWREQILEAFVRCGTPACLWTADYIRKHNVQFSFRSIPGRGADVTFWGKGIVLGDDYSLSTSPNDRGLLQLIAHEAKHLEQGHLLAWSIQGELEAWQFQYQVHRDLGGGSKGEYWDALAALPVNSDPKNLRTAQDLIWQITVNRATGVNNYPPAQRGFPLLPAYGFGPVYAVYVRP